jgi:hypothetical protein
MRAMKRSAAYTLMLGGLRRPSARGRQPRSPGDAHGREPGRCWSRARAAVLGFAACAAVLPVFPARAQMFNVGMYRPWTGYAVTNGLWMTGDFNGDQRQDIVHAVRGTDYVNVWSSDAAGGFSVASFRPWAGYRIPNGVWLTGDFDGDGRTDLFHGVADTDYAHVWLSEGNGRFKVGASRPFPGYGIPNGVWNAGDFNGDGRTDVLHAVAGADYVHLWTSDGTGGFAVSQFRPWAGYGVGTGVWLVGDFNGDRLSDVFHGVANSDYAHVWFADGRGGFILGTVRPWSGYQIVNGEWRTGDFDGDGRTDVLHLVEGTDVVNVWTANTTGGFDVAPFRPWAGYGISNGGWLTGDYDGDGRTDLVHAVENTDYVHLWHSTGVATFAVSTFSPWSGYRIPNGSWLTADFSGDGKTDIVHAVEDMDYVHPWISALAGPAAAARQVAVEAVEVTQAIQNMPHSVTLVAGKATVARVYLSSTAAVPLTVRGTLTIRDPASGATTTVASTGSTTVEPVNGALRARRENLAASLNFIIPPAYTGAGVRDISLASVRNAGAGVAVGCSNCGAAGRSVSFEQSAPLRLHVVGLEYTTGMGPGVQAHAPAAADFALVRSWIGRAYPIAQLTMSQAVLRSTAAWPFECGDVNAQLSAQRALDVSAGTDARTHYIGLVSSGGGYMRGCASGLPAAADPTVVASSPAGPTNGFVRPVNATGDTDASFGDWYSGHELGHTLGRMHPGFCHGNSADDTAFPYPNGQLSPNSGAYTGLDVGDAANAIPMTVLPGATRYDIMTYCNQPQWLTAYTYAGIHARLAAENQIGGTSGGGAASPSGAGAAIGSAANASRAGAAARIFAWDALRLLPEAARATDTLHACSCARRPAWRVAPPRIVTAARRPPVARLSAQVPPPLAAAAGREPPLPPASVRPAEPLPALLHAVQPERGWANPVRRQEPREPPPQVALRRGRYVSVVARVNLTRQTGEIRFVNHLSRALVPTVPAGDRARIRLLDAGHRVLAEHDVWLREDTDPPADQDRMGVMDAVFLYDRRIRHVHLLVGSAVADSLVISRRRPTVRGLRAAAATDQPGLAAPARGVIQWDASDPDGDTLTYVVQVSSSEGRSWTTIGVGVREPGLVLPPPQPGSTPTLVRVIANDGWWSSRPAVARLSGRPRPRFWPW